MRVQFTIGQYSIAALVKVVSVQMSDVATLIFRLQYH